MAFNAISRLAMTLTTLGKGSCSAKPPSFISRGEQAIVSAKLGSERNYENSVFRCLWSHTAFGGSGECGGFLSTHRTDLQLECAQQQNPHRRGRTAQQIQSRSA